MLEKLVIKNFQKHKKLMVTFDERVTTIIGPTDCGKSAAIRALRWVVTNKPAGDAFIRDGASTTSVKLHVDGHIIERKRGKGVNLYVLDDKEFHAFKNDVPPEIAEIVKVGLINFQQQHDNPFWFSETAGQVNKQLNQIINLSSIDEVFGLISKRIRRSKIESEIVDDEITKLEQEKEKTAYVPLLAEDYSNLQRLEKASETNCQKKENLKESVECLGETHLCIKTMKVIAKQWDSVEEMALSFSEQLTQIDILLDLIEQFEKHVKQTPICINDSKLKQMHSLYASTIQDKLLLTRHIKLIEIKEKEVCQGNTIQKKAQKKLFDLTKGRCPICQRKM